MYLVWALQSQYLGWGDVLVVDAALESTSPLPTEKSCWRSCTPVGYELTTCLRVVASDALSSGPRCHFARVQPVLNPWLVFHLSKTRLSRTQLIPLELSLGMLVLLSFAAISR